MPVRIYDIAKKLGLENKDILTKAKQLGIAAAKVPSSSLDKISAEWLEEELIKGDPTLAARLTPKTAEEKPKAAPVEEKIILITAPPPEPPPVEVKPEPAVEAQVESEPAPAPEPVLASAAAASPASTSAPVIEAPKAEVV